MVGTLTPGDRELRGMALRLANERDKLERENVTLKRQNRLLSTIQQKLPAVSRLLAVTAVERGIVLQDFGSHGRKREVQAERKVRLKVIQTAREPNAFGIFREYRPWFSTTAGSIPATLHKLGYSKANGEPIAYYLLRYFDSNAGRYVSGLHVYALRKGKPMEIYYHGRREYQERPAWW
ncbi:hypothetical protein [Bradyrhizobium manausense]|uniref:hypothetical protein n=1 Tax=Bradyrhizobium manausense TaxID=989370 RepID=UPI001BA50AB1|nr:hypothetical protein [Bradyrhizobium manausense]MBR0721751.1 hypothetical protein [Bradyrhizobium manausense]